MVSHWPQLLICMFGIFPFLSLCILCGSHLDQVITMEGWTDIMYHVQDVHSFWNWAYFVVLIVVSIKIPDDRPNPPEKGEIELDQIFYDPHIWIIMEWIFNGRVGGVFTIHQWDMLDGKSVHIESFSFNIISDGEVGWGVCLVKYFISQRNDFCCLKGVSGTITLLSNYE